MKNYLKTLLLLSFAVLFTACEKNDPPYIEVSETTVPVPATATTASFDIDANTPWMIINSNTGISVSPVSGSGKAKVNVTLTPNTSTAVVNYSIIVKQSGNTSGISKGVIISQAAANNIPPTAPVLSLPANNAIDVDIYPTLSWTTSTDANNDPILYEVKLSSDNATWALKGTVNVASFKVPEQLTKGAKYYWKVLAKDSKGGETESTVFAFTVDNTNIYAEGEVKEAELNRAKDKAVNIVIMGDGFVREDLKPGGAYDKAMDKAREAFFAIEPYRSYRDHFNVYYVYSKSEERGATYGWGYDGSTKSSFASQNRSTSFSSTFSTSPNSTSTNSDYQKVFNYARYVPIIKQGPDIVLKPDGNVISGAITDQDNIINKTVVVLVINDQRYAGTCIMYPQGACIGMCPMAVNSNPQYSFEATLRHEVGGHGFGKFVDEYIYSQDAIPASGSDGGYTISAITAWQTQLGFYQNISTKGDKKDAPDLWQAFFTDGNYPEVGMYEGGCTYAKGVWRPESNSIMNNNIDYYSGPCRYFIYKRIKQISGENYSFAEFKTKDKPATPAQMQAMNARAVSPEKFIPLGMPKMMDL